MSIERLKQDWHLYLAANQNFDDYSRPERIRYHKIAHRIRRQLNRLVMFPHKTHKQVVTHADGEYTEGTRSYRRTVIPE